MGMGRGRGRGRVTGHEAAVLPEDEVDRHLLEVLAFLVVPRVEPIKPVRGRRRAQLVRGAAWKRTPLWRRRALRVGGAHEQDIMGASMNAAWRFELGFGVRVIGWRSARARDDGGVDERGVEVERRHGPALLVAEGEAWAAHRPCVTYA